MLLPTTLLVFLFAGSLSASEGTTGITVKAGNSLPLSINTVGQNITNCILINPDEDTVQLIPAGTLGDRYELRPGNNLIGCSVNVRNVTGHDEGVWELYTESDTGVISNQLFDVTVESSENEKPQNDDTVWLRTINHRVRTDSIVTLTLSRVYDEEECFLQPPNGTMQMLEEASLPAVQTFGSNKFVSCRVVIGPIDGSLLGNWTLCGTHVLAGEEFKRCQPAVIQYNNPSNPSANWRRVVQPRFEHAVHFGGVLNPVVQGEGEVVSCHAITPTGDDITLTDDLEYSRIKLVSTDRSLCRFAIGPIDETLLGNWTVYGMYFSQVYGFNEARFPMNLFLYDEENPFNQAYNVTMMPIVNRVVNIGNTIEMGVTNTGERQDCAITLPNGRVLGKTTDSNVAFMESGIGCLYSIRITQDLIGDWMIIGRFHENNRFTEFRFPFKIIKEDPENPLEEDRIVTQLPPQEVVAKLGTTHRITIGRSAFPLEHCHLRTPDGLQYKIMEGFNIPNVEVLDESNINCGVAITATSEDQVGMWTLISREGSERERRLDYTLKVEEVVGMIPQRAIIAEGNDLHLRLADPAQGLKDSCVIKGPHRSDGERDPHYEPTCGFVVRNLTALDSGSWSIVYGNKITYVATANVSVLAKWELEVQHLVWKKNKAVNVTIGPEDAVYCRVDDPTGTTVFDGLGRCSLTIDRVTLAHAGIWRMTVGMPGRVLTDTHNFTVAVNEAPTRTVVHTEVDKHQDWVALSCSVEVDSNVTACKFRDPAGRVLLATPGVAEQRYSYHGVGHQLESNVQSYECGLRITDPARTDLGLWRCAIETETDIHYGFLTALCPWADPPEGVPKVPTLVAEKGVISEVEGNSVTMSCSVQAAIRYCYFRARNGTIFNVDPAVSSATIKYEGDGFEAGECGASFTEMRTGDSGNWSCHVGFTNSTQAEQRANISLTIHEVMSAQQSLERGELVIRTRVHGARALDYCRFIRSDGYGFSLDNVPKRYKAEDKRESGSCNLRVANPTTVDRQPWTVVARLRGQGIEIARQTTLSRGHDDSVPRSDFLMLYGVFMSIGFVALVMFGGLASSRRSRNWARTNASHMRSSIRRKFTKSPLVPMENENKNTGVVV